MSAGVLAAALPALAVAALACALGGGDQSAWLTALDGAAGAALLGGGLFALRDRGGRVRSVAAREPLLLLAAGIAWLAGTVAPGIALLLTLHRGPLVHAALAHPDGRLRGRLAPPAVALAWLSGAVPALAASPGATIALAALVSAAAVRSAAAARGPARAARRAGAAVAIAIVAVLAAGAIARLAGADAGAAVLAAYDVAVLAAALVLARGDRARGIAGLVVELGGARTGGTLRRALGAALGDPDVTVVLRTPDGGHVDDAGRPVDMTARGAGRTITPLAHAGEPVGALIHDAAVLDDPGLVAAISATARIAVGNVQLSARLQAEIEQLAASRRRIVDAAAHERRRLAGELDAGAMRELEAVEHALAGVSSAATARAELALARADVARFAEGLVPPAAGLRAAIADRTRLLPLAVVVEVPDERHPAELERALELVCAEALANVAKHARASRVRIRLSRTDGGLVFEVADDGIGGADPGGSGLTGLSARLAPLGGTLVVRSGAAGGTVLRAVLPANGAPARLGAEAAR
jgi:signal transduction histidine kinase